MPSLFDDELSPPTPAAAEHSDLARWAWRADADERLVAAAREGRVGRFARGLLKAGLPRSRRLANGIASPCRLIATALDAGDSAALEHLTRETLLAADAGVSREAATNHVTALLDAADAAAELRPLVLAAWLSLLPVLGRRLERATLVRFWQRTAEETQRFAALSVPSEADPLSADAELRDEILLRAGVVLSPLADAEDWRAGAVERWRGRVAEAADDVLWPALPAARWQEWLGALVRVAVDAAAYDVSLWKKRHRARLKSLAANAIAALRPDGTSAMLGGTHAANVEQLQTFARLTDWERDELPLRSLKSVSRGRRTLRGAGDAGLTRPGRPGFQSDAASFALLRDSWSPGAMICSVHYAGRDVRLEIWLGGERLVHGVWDVAVSIDDHRLDAIRQWRCQCWFSDRDADFIELSADLDDGVSLLRQVLVARRDKLLIFAEALRGTSPGQRVALRSALPLAEGLAAEADGVTRELQIPLAERRVRVFPAHLPWERTASTDGRLHLDEDGLVGEIHGTVLRGQVLLMNADNRRGDEPADGAILAVGENSRHVAPHEAIAARVRCGLRQWVYWHNLTRGAVPRTCLGHHTDSETVIGCFDPGGELQLLVHVEGDGDEETGENPAKSV